MKVLARVSIPYRLRGEMMLKEANHFDVPDNRDGMDFLYWWEKSAADDRDEVMRDAYNSNISVVDALKKKLGG